MKTLDEAAMDAAYEIKGDMGLSEERYAELIAAFKAGAEWARPRWVSCKERLPKNDTRVLIYDEGGFDVVLYLDDHFMDYLGEELRPSYWTHLPEMPEGEK